MKFTTIASIGGLCLLIQQTPAPAAFVDGIITAVFVGMGAGETSQIVSHIPKRDVSIFDILEQRDGDPFAGLPQPAADECKGQLQDGATVVFSPIGSDGIRIDGVPPACMTLANVYLGENPNQPGPIPMGSASLEYHNLSQEEIDKLHATLNEAQGQ
ncbi:hypothetical protein PHISCL_01222 [Aspergillus sclerotialis]|uniref:Uncharacterized protein n=1 Tax=Aspergillus sclerotialis TaxID=2070753 RepID=A0A3A3AAN6_9EURO|nr:hypothetical protein PHISCL_01222 [Aspergillus sclerotialis]